MLEQVKRPRRGPWAWQGPPSKGRQGKELKSTEKGEDSTKTVAHQGGAVTKGDARTQQDTSTKLEGSHEAPCRMGSQEAEAGETIRTTAQAERPSGASAAQI